MISNSINHNKERKVDIDIKVDIKEKLIITYSDNGIGLHSKYVGSEERIFDLFETTSPNGYGIGMWLIKSIVRRYNGKIKVMKSTKGFKVRMELGSYID